MKLVHAALVSGLLVLTAVNSPAQVGIPRPDHVLIVIEENHAYTEIVGSPAAPYLNSLAQQGALFTESFGIRHPSQPNYLALFSGSTQGITDDSCPHYFGGPNLGRELIDASFTFAGYSESMPTNTFTGCGSGGYARKHNPWVNFTNVPASANLTLASFPTDFGMLPTVAFVIPNLGDDMHNGSVHGGDSWLKAHIDAYAQWATTHHSLLIVTWDEDDHSQSNHIATIFVGPMVQPGKYCGHINHYNVLRTLEDMFGLPDAGASANAAPILNVWTTDATHLTSELTSPANGAVFLEPATLNVAANVSSTGDPVQKVEFFAGMTRLGERTIPPFALSWTNPPAGHYCLNAKVTDARGEMKSSAPIEISVLSVAQALARSQGTYNGLFYDANQVANQSAGFFQLTLTGAGRFTAQMLNSGNRYSWSGQFDSTFRASNTIARAGTNGISVGLEIGFLDTPGVIQGHVSDGVWGAELVGDRGVFNARTNPAPQAGLYTIILPGDGVGLDAPGGDGYGSVSVDPAGNVKFAGALADGSVVQQTAPLSNRGAFPFYVSLYRGKGVILGWVTITNGSLAGSLAWCKAAAPMDKLYPGGFAQALSPIGSAYRPANVAVPLLTWTNGIAEFSGGNLNQVLASRVRLQNNSFTVLGTNVPHLTVSVTLPSGLMSGSFLPPGTTRSLTFKGAVLQASNIASGSFLGTNRSGRVLLKEER